MATRNTEMAPTVLDVISRIIEPKNDSLKPALARYLLSLHFSEADRARVNELAQLNQNGELSKRQKQELDSYVQAGHWLAWLHAKARISLKKRTARGAHA